MTRAEPEAYGVSLRRQAADALDLNVEELEVLGYTVLDSGLAPEVLQDLSRRIDDLWSRQDAQGDLGRESDVVRCPLAADDAFLAAATLPAVIEIARRVLDRNLVLLQQNAIINQPDAAHYQSRWHRDLPYQHFVGSRALAVNALLCIDPFARATGGTFVLPASHRFEAFPTAEFVARHEHGIEAPAGGVIMMDAMLYHRAGANSSAAPRRGINHLIGRPLLAQQIDMPRLLGPRFADDPVLGPYLGYRWNPAADVESWRSGRT
jgi:hypothetical protein